MALRHYLVDTSALLRYGQAPVAAVLRPLAQAKRLSLCAPVAFELVYSARAGEVPDLVDELASYPDVPIRPGTFDRALAVQAELAAQGQHRALSLVDLLVAAAAEAAGVTVLHYDEDFELVAALTGQPVEWVVGRGSADRPAG